MAIDHAGEYARLHMSSVAAMRLAAVSAEAAKGLRHRALYVSVETSLDKAEAAPTTTLEYVARVPEPYHFPGRWADPFHIPQ